MIATQKWTLYYKFLLCVTRSGNPGQLIKGVEMNHGTAQIIIL